MNPRSLTVWIVFFLFIVFLLNFAFINSPGTSDVPIFERWQSRVLERGPVVAYCQSRTDYPPLSFVVLGGFASLFGAGLVSVKLSIFLFWFFYFGLVLFLSYRVRIPFWAGALLASNPAIMINAQFLGYLDIYFAPFLLLSLYLLREKRFLFWSGMAFGVATLLKWQPLIIFPFFLIMLGRPGQIKESSGRTVVAWLGGFGIVWITAILVYTILGDGGCILRALDRTSTLGFKLVSGNALNLNWIVTYFLHVLEPDTYRPLMEGAAKYIRADIPWLRLINTGVVGLAYIFFGLLLWQRGKSLVDLVKVAMGSGLAYFLFAYGVHENHSFLLVVLATCLVLINEQLYAWFILGVLSLFHLSNLILFYGLFGTMDTSRVVMGLDTSLLYALLIIIFFVIFLQQAINEIGDVRAEITTK